MLILIGIDGYFRYGYKMINIYNLVGEWFLGALIIIYFLYPFLSLMMNINIFILNYIISLNYCLMYKTKFFGVVDKNWNIITCINSFYFGMIVIKFRETFFKNRIVLILSFIILIFLSLFQTKTSFVLFEQIQGFSLYIIFIQIGAFIMSTKSAKIFNTLSCLSYSIFLYHHRIIKFNKTI